MLKLKDIFNIDISSKGGGKLYKKIMRKYNIPIKDVKEVKQEIVECSSGGSNGSGVKEYYYKFKEDMPLDSRIFYQLLLLFTASKIDIIVPILNDDNKDCAGEVSIITIFLFKDLNISTYFKISDIIFPIVSSVSDRGNHDINTEIYTEGDLFTKLEHSSILLGDAPELLEMLNIVKDNAITITKEEYESMITYKP